MGADLIVLILPYCRHSDERESMLEAEAKWLIDDCVKHRDDPGCMVNQSVIDIVNDFNTAEETIAQMVDDIGEYWDFDGRRDVTTIFPDNIPYLVTGGMTWGDPPTDAYEVFERLLPLYDMLRKFAYEDMEKAAHDR